MANQTAEFTLDNGDATMETRENGDGTWDVVLIGAIDSNDNAVVTLHFPTPPRITTYPTPA